MMTFDSIADRVDTFDKFVKVVQVLTQGLWYSIGEIRAGHRAPTGDVIYDVLTEVLKRGEQKSYPLPEIENWWAREVLSAYNEVR